MANVRFPGFNEMEIIRVFQVNINKRILLIVRAREVEFAVERNENSSVHCVWKSRRSKLDIIWPFTFRPGEWVGQRFKSDQGLDAIPSHRYSCAILDIVGGKPKEP